MARILEIDVPNRLRYGYEAPLFAERIFIEPERCAGIALEKHSALWELLGEPRTSGKVIEHWPIQKDELLPIAELTKIKFCIDHWVNGVPWEDTGVFEFFAKTKEKYPERRYRKLDRIFETVQKEGRLRTRQEIDQYSFREYDGIRINVGPSGQLVFGEKGTHRLAIALILGIRVVPAQIGCVYKGALGELPRLRASSSHCHHGPWL